MYTIWSKENLYGKGSLLYWAGTHDPSCRTPLLCLFRRGFVVTIALVSSSDTCGSCLLMLFSNFFSGQDKRIERGEWFRKFQKWMLKDNFRNILNSIVRDSTKVELRCHQRRAKYMLATARKSKTFIFNSYLVLALSLLSALISHERKWVQCVLPGKYLQGRVADHWLVN